MFGLLLDYFWPNFNFVIIVIKKRHNIFINILKCIKHNSKTLV